MRRLRLILYLAFVGVSIVQGLGWVGPAVPPTRDSLPELAPIPETADRATRTRHDRTLQEAGLFAPDNLSQLEAEVASVAGGGHPFARRIAPGLYGFDGRKTAYRYDMTLVRTRERWPARAVALSARTVAKVFRQCGVGLERAVYVSVDLADGGMVRHFYDGERLSRTQGALTDLAWRVRRFPEPEVYFVGDWDDYDAQALGYALIKPGRPQRGNPIRFTAWIHPRTLHGSMGITVAHEMGHILLNDGHVRDPGNLMYPTARGGTHLTAKQCAQIRRSLFVRRG